MMLCLGATACGAQPNQDTTTDTTTNTATTTAEPAATRVESDDATEPTAVTTVITEEDDEVQSETESAQEIEPGCRRLADFETDTENDRWVVVNDDVMGGRSIGGLSFVDGSLLFEGEINTDGGGFSSLRLPLQPDDLSPYDRVVFRARPDDRVYMVTFDDNLPGRDRRVSHRSPIGFDQPGQWQTVSVLFDQLFPAVFGNPIDDLPFRKDLATRMGLMISDGVDGSFQLEIDWIDLCPEP